MATNLTYEQLLQGCESEKLHLSGHIQPFGALVCIDRGSYNITHASQNIEELIGIKIENLLGKHIDALDPALVEIIDKLPHKQGASALFLNKLETLKGAMDILLHAGENSVIIEIEKPIENMKPISIYQLQLELLNVPNSSSQMAQYQHSLVEAIRVVTGYDRIMVYRFLDDWSGEVVAEWADDGIGSYLDLRFPASDIPAIARNLYMLNPSRLIPDISTPSVPIYGDGESVPDLTYSDLRSVSPVHIEYLKNMGVRASFSVPIKVLGALWGLLACHNITPKYLPMEYRNICIALVQSFAIGLSVHKASKRLTILDGMERKIDAILEAISKNEDTLAGIQQNVGLLLDLLDAKGIGMAIEDEIILMGLTPDIEYMSALDSYFTNQCSEVVYSCDNLESILPESKDIAQNVSGTLAIRARSNKSGSIRFYWFRPEQPTEVVWAGNPNKPAIEDPNATALSPRRSFEKWVEIKRGFCRPWTSEEKTIALKFRNTLLRWL